MKAVILAAGMGKRLAEYTKNHTKCMVEINGKSLIERLLLQITKYNLDEIIIVTGYKHTILITHIQNIVKKYSIKTNIKYMHNKDYGKTNNIYSLYLVKEELFNNDIILFESDLLFDDNIIKQVFKSQYKNFVLVAPYENHMDGTVVKIDNHYNITTFINKNKFQYNEKHLYYKTANIYRLSKEFSQNGYVYFLEAYIKSNSLNQYYEQVLSVIISMGIKNFKAEIIKNNKWYEIDTPNDKAIAETIFSDSNKISSYYNRYGGYWRFNNINDFCYLVNPYFPTISMINELQNSFQILLTSYPSSINIINQLSATMFNINQNYITTGNGAAELIRVLLLVDKQLTGVIMPSFEEYYNSMESSNIKIYEVENNNFSYNANDIITFIINNNLKRIIIIAPDNPSGYLIPYDEIINILEYTCNKGIEVIFDESFMDFANKPHKYTLINQAIIQKYNNLFIIKSISKSYGIPGLRLGVIISSNITIINKIKTNIPIWNINSFAEYFLQIIDKYRNDFILSCNKLIKNRKLFIKQLMKINNIIVYPTEANFILCKIDIKNFNMEDFLNKMIDNNFLIKNCTNKKGLNNGYYIRIAVKTTKENNMLLKTMKQYFKKYYDTNFSIK